MSVLKSVGIGVAVISMILYISTYYGRALQRGLTLFFLVLGIAYPWAVWLTFGSLVNPMATPWGEHTVGKIIVAGILYAAYPLAILGLRRLSKSPKLLGVLEHQPSRKDKRSLEMHAIRHSRIAIGLVWLPMTFFLIQSIHLIIAVIQTPTPPPSEWLIQKSAESAYAWVLQHPTPAIHHTYAGATFLWSLALGNVLSCFAFPIALWLVDLTRRPQVMKTASLGTATIGLILAIVG